ncbi:MAG: hypothetical protein QF659_05030, partial [Dehalococcoidia bacterium]|nr:hypothetical protein [Dehalococcoidia bacterium]
GELDDTPGAGGEAPHRLIGQGGESEHPEGLVRRSFDRRSGGGVLLGEHDEEVLSQSGYTPGQMSELRNKKVIAG